MSSTEPFDATSTNIAPQSDAERIESILADEPRNLFILVAHQIVLRVAWIFKTESVIMPAFVDVIAGAGWVRGCLPVLNRIGQSVPALVFADRLLHVRHKKNALVTTTVLMGAPFLLLALVWQLLDDRQQWWLPPLFLLLYFAFFSLTGLTQLSFGTLQGKLIRANRRGKLLGLAGIAGAILAIAAAWVLLQRWLRQPDGGFGHIFAFTGAGFVVSGLICLGLSEPADSYNGSRQKLVRHFQMAWDIFRHDDQFRRFAVTAMLFVTGQLLFPHYQALGLGQSGASRIDLMTWVIVQNAGMGVFSIVFGWIADRFGNRLTIRVQYFMAALTPPAAIWLAQGTRNPDDVFWITFVMLGIVPVAFRTMVNYTLEISAPDKHPRYISTLKLCMMIPFLCSPLVGLLIDEVGFANVFLSIGALITIGGLLTFRLAEPRHEELAT